MVLGPKPNQIARPSRPVQPAGPAPVRSEGPPSAATPSEPDKTPSA